MWVWANNGVDKGRGHSQGQEVDFNDPVVLGNLQYFKDKKIIIEVKPEKGVK